MTTVISKSLPGIETGEEKQQVQAENKKPELKSTTVSKSDSFVSSSSEKNEKADPEKDGQFTFLQAGKNFISGLLSPIKAMFSNPILTACMLAVPIGLSFFAGAAAVMQLVGVGLFFFGGIIAVYEFGKGGYKFINSLVNGDKDGMENAFKDVGGGVSGIVMTLFGVRSTATFAGEAKITSLYIRTGDKLEKAIKQGLDHADYIKRYSKFKELIREISFLFTKDGIKTILQNIQLTTKKFNVIKQKNLKTQRLRENLEKKIYKFLSDRDINDLAAMSDTNKNGFIDLFLKKLTNNELSEVASLMRAARKISPSEILEKANKIYEAQKPRIAKRLGVPLEELQLYLPRLELMKGKSHLAGAVSFFHPDGCKFVLSTNSIRFQTVLRKICHLNNYPAPINFYGELDDFIYYISFHEPVHVEQKLSMLLSLSGKDFMRNFGNNIALSTLKNNDQSKRGVSYYLVDFITRVNGFFDYYFVNGKITRNLKAIPNNERLERANRYFHGFANYSSSPRSILRKSSNYFDNILELEARMYSMLERLKLLREAINSSSTNKALCRSKFDALAKELLRESSGFKKPPTSELQDQYKEVKRLMFEIKDLVTAA